MNPNIVLSAPLSPATAVDAGEVRKFNFDLRTLLSLLCAMLVTAASLAIATYAGWLRGGMLVERAMNIALGAVAVLYVHLLPVGWPTLRLPARLCAFALWGIALVVVLYAQLTFFMVSQQRAGEMRAASAPASVTPPAGPKLPPARMLTEITRDAAKVSADLARTEARHCVGDCTSLKARETILAARLAALRTEADEARRHEAAEDRLNDRADRNEALRASLRADPVASVIASWLHTTESRLVLMLAVACAVVLEGAAIVSWLLVSLLIGRARGREMVVSSRGLTTRVFHAVTAPSRTETSDGQRDSREPAPPETVQDTTPTGNDADPVVSDDEQLLKQIREAVRAGQADPTQESIRRLLRCGQPKAGRLNRMYQERYGCRTPRRADLQATQAETPDVATV